MIKAAINGFGRIGRLVFRAGFDDPDIEWVAINNPGNVKSLAHLLKFDSVHKRFPGDVGCTDDSLVINGKKIRVFHELDPEKLPWKELGVDIVAECTGIFLTSELAGKHIKAGAKKVVLSAPAKSKDIKTLVKGVNEHEYAGENIISNGSCTTNCFAPLAKVLNDNFGVEKCFMVTVHAMTADQRIVDGDHKDLRRARAAAMNMVPTTSGAAKAVAEVIPALQGKLHASAIRVPIIDGSLCYATVDLKKKASVEEVNELFRNVAEHHLKGILEYCDEPVVSSDIVSNSASCVFDSLLTEEDGDLVKVVGWYDNEWGYSCRLVDILKLMAKK